jgi:hypothetical protein
MLLSLLQATHVDTSLCLTGRQKSPDFINFDERIAPQHPALWRQIDCALKHRAQ